MAVSPSVQPSSTSIDIAAHLHSAAVVRAAEPLSSAIELFRHNSRMRMLPVVDDAHRPIGAVFEQDVREILYNPYGHALLNNPAFNRMVSDHCRACPIADIAAPLPGLLDLYARYDGSEGMILTRDGQFAGIVTNRVLIRLAAAREAQIAQGQMGRLERVAHASDRFVHDIGALADALSQVNAGVTSVAAATAERTGHYGRRVAAVAAAAEQTAQGMLILDDQGAALAGATARMREGTVLARQAVAEAVTLSAAGSAHGRTLGDSAAAIETTLQTVQTIAGQAKLLAINAAIEAARLGADSGGFAVVAREMRSFAAKTREAVAEIGERIGDIRKVSAEVIDGQSAIEDVVRRVDAMTRSVDEAMVVQSTTARALTDHVSQALAASGDITENVSEMGRMVADAAKGSTAMQSMAGDLSCETARLRDRVSAFVSEMRSAA